MAKKTAKKPVKKTSSTKKAPARAVAKKSTPKKPVKQVKKPAAKAVAKKPAAKLQAKSSTKTNVSKMPSKPAPTKTKAATATKKPATKVSNEQGYKPSEKEEYMSPAQLQYFREKLVIWKNELSTELKETLDNLKEENWQESDIADRATVETDASLELRTRDRYRKLINKINEALVRIDKGDYGYCQETGEEIGLKRLEARPIATLSIEAQERHERDERTHYDEDLEERLA